MTQDLRKYNAQTTRRMIYWGLGLLLVVGLGLIAVFYGWGASLFGLVCLIGMALPISFVLLALFGLDKLVGWLDPDRKRE